MLSEEEKLELEQKKKAYDPIEAIKEDKYWNIAANVMAVFCVVVCVFLHAFFA